MASKLSFGGVFTSVPGAYSQVNRAGLDQLTPNAVGVVALIGEAQGGGAGAGAAIEDIINPQDAFDTYRSGPLREMSLIAFNPSNDGRMGGARKVLCVKVNPAVASAVTLANVDGDALRVTSQDFGLFTSQISVEKAAGSSVGNAFTETFEGTSLLHDDVGGVAWFTLRYTAGSYTTMAATVGTDGSGNPDKLTATGTRVDAAGEATATAFDAGNRVVIPASAAANAAKVVTVYGVNSDGEVDSDDYTLDGAGGRAAAPGDKRWRRVTAATISAAVVGAAVLIQDEAVSTELTLPIAATSIGRYPLTSCPVANRPVTLVSNGATTDPIVLRGSDASGAAQVEAVSLAGAVPVTSTKSWSRLDTMEIGGLPAARNLTLTTTAVDVRNTSTTGAASSRALSCTQVGAFSSGDRVRVVSAAAGDTSLAVRAWGLDVAGAYQVEDLLTDAADGTTPVLGVLTWSAIFGAELTAGVYAAGNISITDETPTLVQTIDLRRLTSGLVAGPTGGIHETTIPVSNTTITLVADAGTVRSVMVEGRDVAGVVQRELVTLTGAVAVTTLSSWSRVDKVYTGDVEAARTVTVGSTYTITGGYTTIQQLADAYNARDGFLCTVLTTAPNANLISELDILSAAGAAAARNVFGVTVDFDADLTEMIRRVNARSQNVTLSRPDGATTVPADTGAPVYLTGGSEGVTTNAHWVAALNTMKGTSEPKSIVVLTSSAAVHALLDAHLVERETTLKREADGKVGLASGGTRAAIKAAIVAFNSRRLSAYEQQPVRYASDGSLTTFEPYAMAVIAAGMQAGAPTPGEPLTRKYISAVDLEQNTAWDPIADADEMLDAGLCFVEEVSGIGWRWVRGITSYLADDNLGNTEQSVNHAVNVYVENLRGFVDERIGEVNFDGTLASVKGIVKAANVRAVERGEITSYAAPSFVLTADRIAISIAVVPPIPFNFAQINVNLALNIVG